MTPAEAELHGFLSKIDPAEIFRRYDKDANGVLDLGEFTTAARKGGKISPSAMTDAELRQLFNAVDTDGSGDVSIDELIAFVWGSSSVTTRTNERTPRPAARKKPDEAKAHLSMLKKKLQSISMTTMGSAGGKADPAEIFRRYDKNANGMLDLGEFTTAVRKGGKISPSVMTAAELRQLFNAVDTDGSGDVSIDELIAFVWGSGSDPSSPTENRRSKGMKAKGTTSRGRRMVNS